MFDWTLFAILLLICVPGILVSLPQLVRQLNQLTADKLPPGKEPPPTSVLIVAGSVQYLLLAAGAAAVGVLLAPRVGLSAPFFAALAAGEWAWTAVTGQFVPALLAGGCGALLFVAAYYGFFRPRLEPQTVSASESLRREMGMASRLLYGGVFEEVLTRWGLMTLLVWLGSLLVGEVTAVLVWAAIILSGVIFGLLHLPSYVMAGSRATPFFVAYMVVMNLWASLIFGWLFWQYGLLAAILAHMLFHLVWWPFDRRHFAADAGAATEMERKAHAI
jgi:hypothetical protein